MTEKSQQSDGAPEALRSIQGIRKRPAMYIGGIDEAGMQHVVCEVISNSVDEVLRGQATRVEVVLRADGRTVAVKDDGTGMPFDVKAEGVEDQSLATQYLTHIHAKPTADDHAPHIHLHSSSGCGVVVANALSKTFDCASWRDGQRWAQSFERGVPHEPPSVIEEGEGRGTTTKFVLDEQIFGDVRIDIAGFREFLRERATLFQGLDLRFNEESLIAEDGLVDLIRELSPTTRQRAVFHMNETFEDMTIHAAATGEQQETQWHTWANASRTRSHGTHRSGFEKALRKVGWKPALALIHVIMRDPRYAGPTRGELDVPEFEDSLALRIQAKLREFQAEAK